MAPGHSSLTPRRQLQRQSTLLDPEQAIGSTAQAGAKSTDVPGKQSDYAPRRTFWNLNADKIVTKLKAHETLKLMEGYNLTDLPRFNDLVMYNITEPEQYELWSKETHRQPGRLYQLDKLATQLLHASDIAFQDNEILLLNNTPSIANTAAFRGVKLNLLKNYGPNATTQKFQGSIRLIRNNDECIQAVVNYVTGILVQVLMRAAEGDFWDEHCLIAVAKLAAKLKVVALDLPKAAAISIAAEREWQNQVRRNLGADFPPPEDKAQQTTRNIQLTALQAEDVHLGHRYFRIMDAFYQSMGVLVRNILKMLHSNDDVTTNPDVFETSSIMYDTGFRGRRSILCQERSGAIGASGHRGEVHCADFASEVCLDAFENLHGQLPVPESTALDQPYTLIYWKWTELSPVGDSASDISTKKVRTGEMKLRSMRHVITALIPYTMACGEFASQLRIVITNAMRVVDPIYRVRLCTEVRFLAAFLVRTSTYNHPIDAEVTSVWESSISQQRALAGRSLARQPRPPPYGHNELCNILRTENSRTAAGLDQLETWTIDEKSITILYRRYCYGSLGVCATLVTGGLAIGLTVERRINGVDPFNISIFCWTLAAFLALLLKSIRVENWPWRDFLRGRVVCRSVSEVRDVAGMEPQLFLSILLILEIQMMLSKRGRFCVLFTRKADDGFLIDIPITTKAMSDGGCFFAKVVTDAGPALVCVRAPWGQPYTNVEPYESIERGNEAHCSSLEDAWKWGKGEKEYPLYQLSTNSLAWARVVGLFSKDAYF
ncbi:hypothetical protein ASPCAL13236 [Aspergillus calidoustus]|uniref:Uncharacterized protein n=1 Tax=Aspergillus calidoustus TaxID=454130 RepID=A0A0U5GJM4_ASPCI|nr:hypothetical protein ASPCAL13236 [Aspergillus calidoustus]